ncbi:MAG: carboxylating nicotinate-nucleotide diphosphorylase [Dehalococcoidia bacterium]
MTTSASSFDFRPPERSLIDTIVREALDEDRASHDVTSRAVIPPEQPGRGVFLAKAPGVICGLDAVESAFQWMSDDLELEVIAGDGSQVEPGTVFAQVHGPLRPMLGAERVALNLLQRMSGVATLTRSFVRAAAEGGPARVVDTRKTTPGLRDLERYAVRVGGGHNHRNTLEDGILLKDNHIAAAALRGLGIAELIEEARSRSPHTLRVEIEVEDAAGALLAIAANADVIMLDNMSPDEMRGVIEAAPDGIVFEASGGVNLETVRAIAATGVDLISVGALTHSAPALDISLEIEPA